MQALKLSKNMKSRNLESKSHGSNNLNYGIYNYDSFALLISAPKLRTAIRRNVYEHIILSVKSLNTPEKSSTNRNTS